VVYLSEAALDVSIRTKALRDNFRIVGNSEVVIVGLDLPNASR
jgi:hypothetical protein